jgi:hypothetical protein
MVLACLKVIFGHSYADTEENQGKPQSGLPKTGPRQLDTMHMKVLDITAAKDRFGRLLH